MAKSTNGMGKFLGILLVVLMLTAVVAVILPALSAAKRVALESKMRGAVEWGSGDYAYTGNAVAPREGPAGVPSGAPARPVAQIRSLQAKVDLQPTLTKGMQSQESIYRVNVAATLTVARPRADAADCEIELPLPPQIISVSDLTVKVNGEPSEDVAMREAKLVWHGSIGVEPATVLITYAADGKGIYTLDIPRGHILDAYKIELTARGSDVRMPTLSLQPTAIVPGKDSTAYTWDYKRLLFGRPIALDVLGVAAVDRLSQLAWLGPVSVVFFGVFLALIAQAFCPDKLDHWMLLLIVGVFTAAYPLMYFAQEQVDSLTAALTLSALLVLAVIGIRAVTLFGLRLGLLGVVAPAGVIMGVTLVAAVRPNLQGILLTALTIAIFILATTLAPRIKSSLAERRGPVEPPLFPPPLPQSRPPVAPPPQPV